MSKFGGRTELLVGGAVATAASLYFFSDKVSFLKDLGTKPRKIFAPPPVENGRGGGGGGGNGSSNGYDGEGSNDTYEMVINTAPYVAVVLLIAAAVFWPRLNSGGSTQAA